MRSVKTRQPSPQQKPAPAAPGPEATPASEQVGPTGAQAVARAPSDQRAAVARSLHTQLGNAVLGRLAGQGTRPAHGAGGGTAGPSSKAPSVQGKGRADDSKTRADGRSGEAPTPAAGGSPGAGPGVGAAPLPTSAPGPAQAPVTSGPAPASGAGAARRTTAGEHLAAFLRAPASRIASGYDGLGADLARRRQADRQDLLTSTPPLRVGLRGAAAPGARDPGAAAASAPAPAPAAPSAPKGRAPADGTRKDLDRPVPQPTGGSVASLPDGMPPAGPVYTPTKDCDLGESDAQRQQASADASAQGAALQTRIAGRTDGTRVQPVELERQHELDLPAAAAGPPTASGPHMQEYVDLDLPAHVRVAADARLQPRLDARLAGTRQSVDDANAQRAASQDQALQQGQAESERLSAEAQARQDGLVDRARGDIEDHKQAGLDEARQEVASFEEQAGDAHAKTVDQAHQEIDSHQKQADDKVDEANKQTAAEKQKAREQEAEERRKAEEKKKHRKWWQKIGDFFSNLVKAVANAVKAIVHAVGKVVTGIINAARSFLKSVISALQSVLKSLLKTFASLLKGLVDKLIGSVFPALAAKLNQAIDATVEVACQAVDAVADGLAAAVDKLADTVNKAVAIAEKLATAAVDVASALAQGLLTGDFLEALKQAFLAACEGVGLPGQELLDMLAKAGQLIWEIIKHPGSFLGNLLESLKGGFKMFVADIVPNFLKGLMGWLFGEVAATGITLPKSFDLQGILGVVLQVIGLTMDNVRAQAVAAVGEQNAALVDGLLKFVGILFAKGPGGFFGQLLVALKALPGLLVESAAGWAESRWGPRGRTIVEGLADDISALFAGGPAAMWAHIKGQLSAIKDAVIDGIRDWVMEKVVTIAIEKLVTMSNPAGAFLQACITIYRTIKFFVEKIQQIMAVVNKVLDSIGIVAKGLIQTAAKAIDQTMIATLPLVIGFLADLIGLGGIGAKVRQVIEAIQKPVNGAIQWLFGKLKAGIDWLVAKVKALASKAKDAVKDRLEGRKAQDDEQGDEPDGPDTRTAEEKREALAAAQKDLQEALASADSTGDLATTFADIKRKHRLKAIGFEPAAGGGSQAFLEINPKVTQDLEIAWTNKAQLQGEQGSGLSAQDLGKNPATSVSYQGTTVKQTKGGDLLAGSQQGITMGRVMEASPLGPDHQEGTKPSTQKLLLSLLPTQADDSQTEGRGNYKYIRGHLLNGHLGGSGKDDLNLTPFTASANHEHEAAVEHDVKQWVNDDKTYAYYKVEITSATFKTAGAGAAQKLVLDSTIAYEAYQVAADDPGSKGKPGSRAKGSKYIKGTITSTYGTDPDVAGSKAPAPAEHASGTQEFETQEADTMEVALQHGSDSGPAISAQDKTALSQISKAAAVTRLQGLTRARARELIPNTGVRESQLTTIRNNANGVPASSAWGLVQGLSKLDGIGDRTIALVVQQILSTAGTPPPQAPTATSTQVTTHTQATHAGTAGLGQGPQQVHNPFAQAQPAAANPFAQAQPAAANPFAQAQPPAPNPFAQAPAPNLFAQAPAPNPNPQFAFGPPQPVQQPAFAPYNAAPFLQAQQAQGQVAFQAQGGQNQQAGQKPPKKARRRDLNHSPHH